MMATSVAASAQVFQSSLKFDTKSMNMETIKQHPVQVSAPLTKKVDFKAANNAMKKVDGITLPMKAVQTEYTNMEDGINRCSIVEFVEANITDEEGNIYDIGINNFGGQDGAYKSANGGEETIYGQFDPETKTITVPAGQFIYQVGGEGYDFSYECYLYGWDKDDEFLQEFTFTIDEEGSIESDVAVYQVLFEDPDDGNQYYMWMGSEPRFLPVNAIQTGYSTRSENWDFDVDDPAAVEDFEYSINIMNFLGNNLVTADIDDDLTVTFPAGQIVGDYDYVRGAQQNGGTSDHYYYLALSVDTDEKNRISGNYEDPIIGHIEGNTLYVDDICIQTESFGEGYVFRDAYYSDYQLTLDEGNFKIVGDNGSTGIVNANNTREYKIKNTPTYNLMGQQVSRKQVKGIMVRDGKKYIAK